MSRTKLNWIWEAAWRSVLSTMVAALGACVVWGTMLLLSAREPYVSLSPQGQPSANRQPRPASAALRFAVATRLSPKSAFATYRQLVSRICRDVHRKEVFVLRPSYAEMRHDLERGLVDVALVCTGTYAHSRAGGKIDLLVQPEFEEGWQYRSVLLVPADSPVKGFDDLRGKTVAFTDVESHTGCAVPSAILAEKKLSPRTFFGRVLFTGSHDRSIRAVERKLVDAAAVDSLIWQWRKEREPQVAERVKVVYQSEVFGPPPIVVPANQDPQLVRALRNAFLALDKHDEGRRILKELHIRRFIPARPQDYQTAVSLYARYQALRHANAP